jgi:hypothetical protein
MEYTAAKFRNVIYIILQYDTKILPILSSHSTEGQ